MPGEWQGRDTKWGKHQDGFWNDALDLAKDEGWTYRTLSSHRKGEVRCPSGEHSQKVDSTSRHSETKAEDLKKLVTQICRHGTRTKPLLAEAERLLSTGRALVERAEAGVILIDVVQEADAKLAEAEQLELLLETAAANFAEILSRRDQLLDEAAAAPDAPDPAAVLEAALEGQQRCRSARQTLNPVSDPMRKEIVNAARDLEARADTIRSRLSP